MATIAIFDSGVGGLSVYDEAIRQCPEHDYVFISDNQAFPYGTKSSGELSKRVLKVVGALLERYQPDLLVIACNTASTVMLPTLRSRFDLPIVGVVPAIKPASLLSQSGVIGILATPATIQRAYTSDLIHKFANQCEVIKVGSTELVQLAENKLRGQVVDMSTLAGILEPVLARPELDILVLACTHFPLLNNEIALVFQQNKHTLELVDSGVAVAKRIASLLNQEPAPHTTASRSIAVFTKPIDDDILTGSLSKRGFTDTQSLLVEA